MKKTWVYFLAAAVIGCGKQPMGESSKLGRTITIKAEDPRATTPIVEPKIEIVEPRDGQTFIPDAGKKIVCRVKLIPVPGERLPQSPVIYTLKGSGEVNVDSALLLAGDPATDGSIPLEGLINVPTEPGKYRLRVEALWSTVIRHDDGDNGTRTKSETKVQRYKSPTINIKVDGAK